MQKRMSTGWSKGRLRVVLLLLFVALAIPTVILIVQASRQIKWEAFHQQRTHAESLVASIDRQYRTLIERENSRPFTDYSFLNILAAAKSSLLQQSPLSAYPVAADIPGLIGYFQIDNQGRFTTPVLPESFKQAQATGLSSEEYQARKSLARKLRTTLVENKLIMQVKGVDETADIAVAQARKREQSIPGGLLEAEQVEADSYSSSVETQAGFDKLRDQRLRAQVPSKTYAGSLGRVEDLKLKKKFTQQKLESRQQAASKMHSTEMSKRSLRKERNVLPSPQVQAGLSADGLTETNEYRVNIFESEIDTHEFSALDSGHFVLFRKVWRNEQRYIQGMLIDSRRFIAGVIDKSFQESPLSRTSKLLVAYAGNVMAVIDTAQGASYPGGSNELQGTLLLQERLSSSLDQLQLLFSVNHLPAGPGGVIISWSSVVILLVLCGGFLLIYYLGVKQIGLNRQQQDFVSAVSHELKTPLTSIRMYGEMLREGWVSDQKRKIYYDYIFDESERLSRLINNVLQLARLTRNTAKADLRKYTVAQLLDEVQSKVQTLLDRNEFVLNRVDEPQVENSMLRVDIDYFTQIIINLIDNAIKFSRAEDKKQIDISCRVAQNKHLQFCIRDYGPGIDKQQQRKIFELFYRSGNELTRETSGTGIGLALVKQLVEAMHGSVNVVTCDPGTEFCLILPASEAEN